MAGMVTRIRELEAERDRLSAELEAARAALAEADRARKQVLDRIDWVIDSLHNLVDE
jgi:outer membrane murein-binding lipoprotein Lpp